METAKRTPSLIEHIPCFEDILLQSTASELTPMTPLDWPAAATIPWSNFGMCETKITTPHWRDIPNLSHPSPSVLMAASSSVVPKTALPAFGIFVLQTSLCMWHRNTMGSFLKLNSIPKTVCLQHAAWTKLPNTSAARTSATDLPVQRRW